MRGRLLCQTGPDLDRRLSRRHLLRRDPPLNAGQLQAEQAILTMTTYEFWEQDNGITDMAAVRNIEDLNAEFSAANFHM